MKKFFTHSLRVFIALAVGLSALLVNKSVPVRAATFNLTYAGNPFTTDNARFVSSPAVTATWASHMSNEWDSPTTQGAIGFKHTSTSGDNWQSLSTFVSKFDTATVGEYTGMTGAKVQIKVDFINYPTFWSDTYGALTMSVYTGADITTITADTGKAFTHAISNPISFSTLLEQDGTGEYVDFPILSEHLEDLIPDENGFIPIYLVPDNIGTNTQPTQINSKYITMRITEINLQLVDPNNNPILETEAATDVGDTTATLNGDLNSLGEEGYLDVSFGYGSGAPYEYWTATTRYTEATEDITANITGLQPGTTYYYQIYGRLADGSSVSGEQQSFTTTGTAPSVTTVPLEEAYITSESAQLIGNLTSLGDYDEAEVSFIYRENGTTNYQFISPGYPPGPVMSEPGLFSEVVYGLQSGTSYDFRARATVEREDGSSQTVSGDWVTFTTDSVSNPLDYPIVVTLQPTMVGNTTATLNGELVNVGMHTPVSLWFQIRRAGETAWNTVTPLVQLNEIGAYDLVANSTTSGIGIIPNTTYEYRAVAVNGYPMADGGVGAYGDIVAFTTNESFSPPTFIFTLNPATAVTAHTATLTGQLTNAPANASVTAYFDYGIGNTLVNSYPAHRTGPGLVTYNASSLQAGTTYWYQARVYVDDSYWVSPKRTFTTLNEDGTTPTPNSTPTGTGTPLPIGPITIPPSWNTVLGRYLIIIIAMVLTPVFVMFAFTNKNKFIEALGAILSTLVDVIILVAAIVAGWIDPIILSLILIIGGYVIWKIFLSPRAAHS